MENITIRNFIDEVKRSNGLDKIKHFLGINQYFGREIFHNLRLSGMNTRDELLSIYADLRKIIIELENPYLLMKLDLKLLENDLGEQFFRSDIEKDVCEIASLLKKILQPYFDKIDYQLNIKNKFQKDVHNFGDEILGCNCESIIEIIRFLLYYERELKKRNINIDVMGMFYQQLRTKELSFIYAQFSPNKKDGIDYPFDKDKEHRNRLYDTLWKRSIGDLQQFIRNIIRFYYANTSEGMIACFVGMLQQYGSDGRVKVCEFMQLLNFELDDELYDFSFVYDMVDDVERIIPTLREDQRNKHSETFFDYMNRDVQKAKDRQYNLHLKF